MRTTTETEEYPEHEKRDVADAITYQFEVATSDYLSDQTISSDLMDELTTEDVCSGNYSQDGDATGWRVPSLKEMYMMSKLGLIDASTNYAIRTIFGEDNYYAYNGSSDYQYIYTWKVGGNTPSDLHVRCVRDVSNTPSGSTAEFYVPTTSVSLESGQETNTFSVVADESVSWTVTSSNSAVWVAIEGTTPTTSTITGSGTKTITVYNPANTGTSAVISDITVTTTSTAVSTKSYTVAFTHAAKVTEKTYSWSIANGDFSYYTASSVGSPSLTWEASSSPDYDRNRGYYSEIDSYNGTFTLYTTGLSSKMIKSVTVTARTAKSSASCSVAVSVGSYIAEAQTLSTQSADYTFDCNTSSGTVTITFTNTAMSSRSPSAIPCFTNIEIEYYDAE